MKLLDLLTAPWAIDQARLIEMQDIYATHLRGEKIDIAAIEARLGRPLANEQQKYTVQDGGVAVLPIEGVLAPKANLFMQISGGASTQMLGQQVQSTIADNRVKSIILAIDSPGGSVFGTPELAAMIKEAAAIKPIVAVTDATMASAAYWIGSAANAVFMTGPTVQVGSIGVVSRHSYKPNTSGEQVTEITAGKYKRMASGDKPLDEAGKAYMQDQVDHLYNVFVDTVSINRAASVEQVLAYMADGRVFIGQQAIDRGLVDGFSTVDAMVEQLATNPAKFTNRRKAVFALGKPMSQFAGVQAVAKTDEPVLLDSQNSNLEGTSTMDMKDLEQQHPALFAQIQADAMAQATAAAASASATAATAECERIAGVRATALPGHEALVEALAFDGKTTPAEAALAVNAAHRASIAAAAAAHANDAPKALPHAAAPSNVVQMTAKDIAKQAVALASGQNL